MQRITKLISSISEATVRQRRLGLFLKEVDPVVAASAVEESALSTSDPFQKQFYLTLAHLLLTIRPRPPLPAGPLPLEDLSLLPGDEQISGIIDAARQVHAPFCATLLEQLWAPNQKEDARLLPPHLSIEHLALGTRRERARSPRRAVLEPLLVETTPSVVQLLARNTRMREPDIIQMAAMRPNHPYALWALLLNHRWLASDAVREACCRNPVAKPWMILALAPLLGVHKLREVVKKVRLDNKLLSVMQPLYGGACERTIKEAMARGDEAIGPLVFEIEETYDDAKSFIENQRTG